MARKKREKPDSVDDLDPIATKAKALLANLDDMVRRLDVLLADPTLEIVE